MLKRLPFFLIGLIFGAFLASTTIHAAGPDDRLIAGDIFRDCDLCPELVVIPSGSFLMGSERGKRREKPVHKVTIAKPFAVGRYEVTFAEFDACTAAGACSKKIFDRDWGRGRRPVMNVLYTDIQEYLTWLNKITGKRYRLPTEAEWEYAARADSDTEYSWGDEMIKGEANCRGCGTEWSGVKSAPVGSFEPNPWGLYDVHGNVLEMVEDCWITSHVGALPDGRARHVKNCPNRVVKGGAWYYLSKVSRSASRARNDIRVFSYFIGFRVVRELD